MSRPDPREVAVILERIRQTHPEEARTLMVFIEQTDSEDKLIELVRDVSETKGRAIQIMERIEPTYNRAIRAIERENELKDRELDLKDRELRIKEKRGDQRMALIVRPVIVAILAFLAGLASTLRDVIAQMFHLGGGQ